MAKDPFPNLRPSLKCPKVTTTAFITKLIKRLLVTRRVSIIQQGHKTLVSEPVLIGLKDTHTK